MNPDTKTAAAKVAGMPELVKMIFDRVEEQPWGKGTQGKVMACSKDFMNIGIDVFYKKVESGVMEMMNDPARAFGMPGSWGRAQRIRHDLHHLVLTETCFPSDLIRPHPHSNFSFQTSNQLHQILINFPRVQTLSFKMPNERGHVEAQISRQRVALENVKMHIFMPHTVAEMRGIMAGIVTGTIVELTFGRGDFLAGTSAGSADSTWNSNRRNFFQALALDTPNPIVDIGQLRSLRFPKIRLTSLEVLQQVARFLRRATSLEHLEINLEDDGAIIAFASVLDNTPLPALKSVTIGPDQQNAGFSFRFIAATFWTPQGELKKQTMTDITATWRPEKDFVWDDHQRFLRRRDQPIRILSGSQVTIRLTVPSSDVYRKLDAGHFALFLDDYLIGDSLPRIKTIAPPHGHRSMWSNSVAVNIRSDIADDVYNLFVRRAGVRNIRRLGWRHVPRSEVPGLFRQMHLANGSAASGRYPSAMVTSAPFTPLQTGHHPLPHAQHPPAAHEGQGGSAI